MYLKQFLEKDVKIVPFHVNKSFEIKGDSEATSSYISIERYLGQNITSSFYSQSAELTGKVHKTFKSLVYHSVKHLYYSNYQTSSTGDPIPQKILIPGSTQEGDDYIGDKSSQGRFENYNQSTLNFAKVFPTSSNAIVGVLSIPSRLYGDFIQPTSFRWTVESGSVYDDGEGNLILENTQYIVGNIYYSHGIATLIYDPYSTNDIKGYGTSVYGTDFYGESGAISLIENFVDSSNLTCSFASQFTLMENQFKCTIKENEFNLSLNPSLLENKQDGTLKSFATSSNFTPYITTIGIYDNEQDLIAVAKLSQPYPISKTTDTTIFINIDK